MNKTRMLFYTPNSQKKRKQIMDYMKSRHYKYIIGRFNQPDPVNGSIENTMSWNLYTYVNNNALNYIDPFGLMQAWTSVPKGYGQDTPELSTPHIFKSKKHLS